MSIRVEDKTVELIDAHLHTFPDKIADKALAQLQARCGIEPCTNGTILNTLEKLKEFKVDRALQLNIATSPHQQTTINNTAIENMKKYGDTLIPFGSVHYDNEDALNELTRIKEAGIKGIKLHPDYQAAMIDDERWFPIYEKCSELEIPIIFHAGYDCYSPELVHAPPKASRNVIDTFPKLKIVLAHFGGFEMWDEVEKYLIGKNVWLDTAMCATYADKANIERLIGLHDNSQIVFGSDCPWENPFITASFINSMNIPADTKVNIFSSNIKKLLSL